MTPSRDGHCALPVTHSHYLAVVYALASREFIFLATLLGPHVHGLCVIKYLYS